MADKTFGSSTGLTILAENQATPANGMVAYITSSWNSGYQNGDIKGAFLSDTDDTDLVGSGELVDTVTGPVGTTFVSRGTLTDAGGGYWQLTGNDAIVSVTASTDPLLTIGETYVVTLDVTSISGTIGLYQSTGQNSGLTSPAFLSTAGATGVFTATIVAEKDTLTIFGPTSGLSSTFKVSVKLADADRSVSANGLVVNGTVTRSPVATGADLVAYSGFSASNYLEQPYNSDLDFGTGDFCVMGWVKGKRSNFNCFLHRNSDKTTAAGLRFMDNGAGQLLVTGYGGGLVGGVYPANDWFLACFVRKAGVGYIYLNGILAASGVWAANVNDAGATVAVGGYWNNSLLIASAPPLALWRISATAPTAEQIAKIYNDEKVLFQENAAATLYGTSDAVTALAHDEDTGLLHVGTSAGRSVFQGLRRVSNTTTAVGTAISASNNLIVEE